MKNETYRQPEENKKDALQELSDEQLDIVSGGQRGMDEGDVNLCDGVKLTRMPHVGKQSDHTRFG